MTRHLDIFMSGKNLGLNGLKQTTVIVAKRLAWKSPSPPYFRLWTMDMISVIQMERLRFLRSNAIEKSSVSGDHFSDI